MVLVGLSFVPVVAATYPGHDGAEWVRNIFIPTIGVILYMMLVNAVAYTRLLGDIQRVLDSKGNLSGVSEPYKKAQKKIKIQRSASFM